MTPPVLVRGFLGGSYPWSQPQELWDSIPDAQLAVVPGCAHAVHLEKPVLFNALVREFLG